MLIVHRVAQGGHRYYLESVGPDAGLDPAPLLGEAAGRWMGAGAHARGLEGIVAAADLRRMLPQEAGRLPGLDLTFAAPKSVSVLHGVGTPDVVDAVRAAHDHAVQAGMAYLERHACVVRDRARPVVADGFVAAAFRHRVSRADDPHLHTHVVVANRASVANGADHALLIPLLYAERRGAAAVYHLALRYQLARSIGAEWRPPVRGCADVVSVPDAVRTTFSQRHAQVVAGEREHRRSGERDRGRRRYAERVTRPERLGLVDAAGLAEQWRTRAAALGWEPTTSRPRHLATPSPPLGDIVPSDDRWTRSDVLARLADAWRDGADAVRVEAETERVLAGREVIRLGRGAGPRHAAARFTTVGAQRRATLVAERLRSMRTVDGSPDGLHALRSALARGGGSMIVVAPDAAAADTIAARAGVVAVAAAAVVAAPHATVVLVRPERTDSAILGPLLAGAGQAVVAVDAARQQVERRRGAVATVSLPAGSVSVAGTPSVAAQAAMEDWVAARRRGVRAVLVAPASEVAAFNAWAREELRSAGLVSGADVRGFATGDIVWFSQARPALGLARHEVADVVGVGGRDRVELSTASGRLLSVTASASMLHAHAVPPVPAVVAQFADAYAVGVTARGATSHRYITVFGDRGLVPPAWMRTATTAELEAAIVRRARCGPDDNARRQLEDQLRLRRAALALGEPLGASPDRQRSREQTLALAI